MQFPPGRMGDANAKMGPLVSQIQWDRVQTLLKKGVEEGARRRDKSDCHFRNTDTEYDGKPGVKWLSCTTK